MEDYSYLLENKIDRNYFINEVLKESANKNIVLVGIGTDKCIGDSFGPFCGSLISEMNLENIIVYGTLEEPIHALNVRERSKQIMNKHKDDFVIALDACIVDPDKDLKIFYRKKSIEPGKGGGKKLPPVGNSSVVFGIYDEYGSFLYSKHRLGDVYKAAKGFAYLIKEIDELITNEREIVDEVSFDIHGQE